MFLEHIPSQGESGNNQTNKGMQTFQVVIRTRKHRQKGIEPARGGRRGGYCGQGSGDSGTSPVR